MNLWTWILVAAGGAVGTSCRFGLAQLGRRYLPGWFPWGTMAANLLGSFLLGLMAGAVAPRQILGADARLVLGTGVLGGFTTYSSFNTETLLLADQGAYLRATAYVALTVIVCLAAGLIGMKWGRSW